MMEIRIARLDPRLLQTPDQVAPEPTSVQSGAKKTHQERVKHSH